MRKRRPKLDDVARIKVLRAEVRRLRGEVRRVEQDKRALQERNAFLLRELEQTRAKIRRGVSTS